MTINPLGCPPWSTEHESSQTRTHDSYTTPWDTIERYIKLHNPGAIIEVQTNDNRALICYDDITPGFPHNPQICDLALSLTVNFIRLFMGKGWKPLAVFLVRPQPEDIGFYQKTFKAPLLFGQDINAIEIDVRDLDATAPLADPELRRFLTRHVEQLEGRNLQDTRSIVEQLIRSRLSTGLCTEEQIAATLHITSRTLQRRLKAEGIGFKQLLTQIRCSLAEEYLRSGSFTKLAAALGYSELSAFTRFFHAHFGMSPTQYRQSLLARRNCTGLARQSGHTDS